MKKTNSFDHPLFYTSSLHTRTERGEGQYQFLLDAIVCLGDDSEICKHEAAHRAYVLYHAHKSSFHTLRLLVGISHTLLSLMLNMMIDEWQLSTLHGKKFTVHGNKLGDIHLLGGIPDRTSVIENLLHRIQYVESLFDMAWRGLVPIAEIGAIDFTEGVGVDWPRWNLYRKKDLSSEDLKRYNEQKTKLVERAIADYPEDFGGYHIRFGSFQNAMRKVWAAYNKIEMDKARHELLRLAMTILYLHDDDIYVGDPIKIILDNARFAQEHGGLASSAFSMQFHRLESYAQKLIESIETQVLADIPGEYHETRRFVEAVEILATKQWQYGGGRGVLPLAILPTLFVESREVEASFMRFFWDDSTGGKIYINPAFLIAPEDDLTSYLGLTDLPKDWWRKLVFLETLRSALKTGTPLFCPFRDWKIQQVPYVERSRVVCSESCVIRQTMRSISFWKDLVAGNSLCDIEPMASFSHGVTQKRNEVSTIQSHKESTPPHTTSTRTNNIDPQSRILANLGNRYLEKKQYEDALRAFARAIELQPNYADALAGRAKAHIALRRYEESIDDLNRAIELVPSSMEAFAYRGLAYQQIGSYSEALADFTRFLERRPDNAWALARRGEVYLTMERYEKAVADLTQALKVWFQHIENPQESRANVHDHLDADLDFASLSPQLAIEQGQLYRIQKQYDKALTRFSHAIEELLHMINVFAQDEAPLSTGMFSYNVEMYKKALTNRGLVYKVLKHYDKALDDFTNVIDITVYGSFYDIVSLANRGLVYYQVQRYDEALSDFTHLIERQPDSAYGFLRRGDVYMTLKRKKEALADYARAIELDPDYVNILANRGGAYLALKHYDEALLDFERIIEIQPNNTWALAKREEVYTRLLHGSDEGSGTLTWMDT